MTDEAQREMFNDDGDAAELCPWCSEPLTVEVLEVWGELREFDVTYCCEPMRDWMITQEFPYYTRQNWKDLFNRAGVPIRQTLDDGARILADFGLELRPVDLKTARAFVLEHHRHNRPPVGWKFGAALVTLDPSRPVEECPTVAVMMAGRPVARRLDDGATIEVNRVCVREIEPHGVTWNACSMLYGYACREARARGYRKVITYTLETEKGTSLEAAGFRRVATTKGGSWHRDKRPRTDKASTCKKVRWERTL